MDGEMSSMDGSVIRGCHPWMTLPSVDAIHGCHPWMKTTDDGHGRSISCLLFAFGRVDKFAMKACLHTINILLMYMKGKS